MSQLLFNRRRSSAGSESAQTAVWMLAVIALTVFTLTALQRWVAATVSSGRLDATADLVALAGVVGGEAEARSVATRNGASVMQFDRHGERVEVVVRSQGLVARASAAPRDLPP